MIPAGAFSVVVFFLFVAPGICYELLRDRTRLPHEETTFVHVSRVLLAGTFITALSLFLLTVVRWLSPTALLDLPNFLRQPNAYLVANTMLVGWSVLMHLLLSGLLAIVFSDLSRKQAPIHHGDAWHAVCERAAELAKAEEVTVSVHLKSGRDILGIYVGASTDLEPTKRELIIGAPLAERRAGSEETVPLNEDWQRMVITGAEIESVAMCYVGEVVARTPAKRRFVHKASGWVQRHWSSWKLAVPTTVVLLMFNLLL